MRVPIIIFAAAVVSVGAMLVSCGNQENPDLEAARRANDSLQAIVDSKNNEVDALFDMLNQIEDNLSMISAKYGAVRELQHNNPEASYSVKTEITNQLSSLDQMMVANKKKIADLNAKLKALGQENGALQEFVTKLEDRINSQESQIAELQSQLEYNKEVISGLNQDVSNLTEQNAQKDRAIAQHIAEANRVYYIVGNYDYLKQEGVVSKNGGFIGIGKKQGVVSNLPVKKFIEIDRSKTTTIDVNMKNAIVVSSHPESSYEMVPAENNEKVTAYLRILDPALFWRNTKYLVISTK